MASWPLNTMNRAVGSVYEMGSVFKTFTIAAAVDAGRADMNSMLDASRPI
jgi:cell division protein FtsI (penicillin-binding protein 3)